VRNILSVENFTNTLSKILEKQTFGIFNIVSNNNLSLGEQISTLYGGCIPNHINIFNGDESEINLKNSEIVGETIIVNEEFGKVVSQLETEMVAYHKLVKAINITKLPKLSQPRGEMVEISSLPSTRLYKITLSSNSIRGNHYHHVQTEEFYTNRGTVLYLLAYPENTNVIMTKKSIENEIIQVPPRVIHTLTNDYSKNIPEIIIVSTQPFIKNKVPDTEYIDIINT
jgi:dTDP-4-dehydrorhamnose 3,5-epimerase-like enzyme